MKSEESRMQASTLSCVSAILCNLFLFALKFSIGMVMSAMAITSDAFNNLTDCITNIISFFGYRLANKPADSKHPFGHGRLEYIVSFIASILILAVAASLFMTSFDKILHPEKIHFSLPLFIILLSSILIKVWMFSFNKFLGERCDSTIMLAVSQDAKNDCMTTGVTLLAVLVSLFLPKVPVDGIMGVVVSILIFKAGIELAMSIMDRLLGTPIDLETFHQIQNILKEDKRILDMHDLIIHDYGMGRRMGTCHIAMDANLSFLQAHEIADEAEQRIRKEAGVDISLHMDPIEYDNEELNRYRSIIRKAMDSVKPGLSMHDLRIRREDGILLTFDVVVPSEAMVYTETLTKTITQTLAEEGVRVKITYDPNYIEASK